MGIFTLAPKLFGPIHQGGEEDLSQYGVHNYKIEGRFLEEKKALEVEQKIDYKNLHKKAFDKVYFHLYPNAFKEEEGSPFFKDELKRAYPMGFEPGYIDIEEVQVEDKKASYEIGGEDNTILAINLAKEIKPDEIISIVIKYTIKLPPAYSRFGYGENTYNFGNWYPIAAIYDYKGWNIEPYYKVGDPFYSEISNYQVTLKLSKEFTLATTGNIKSKKSSKEKNIDYRENIWQIEAQAVRDFAWLISKDFKLKKGKADNTDIRVYYFKGQEADEAVEVAQDAIKIFNNLFYPYPYQQLSVASCDFYIGGMEYPNLVYIDYNQFSNSNTLILEYIIAHETAHQWWYGIIGNDQVNSPWIDEALTEYSTILYYREKYGEETMMHMLKTMVIDDYVRGKKLLNIEDERIGKSVDEFKNNMEYSSIVYSKGAMMFYELEREIGRENFQKVLKYYVENNKFKNVGEEEIQDIVKAVTGKDYEEFFNKWLEGDVSLDAS